MRTGKEPGRMKLSLLQIINRLAQRIMRRPPDFIIGGAANPYLLRWYVLGSRPDLTNPGRRTSRTLLGLCRIYIHRFDRSDDDRAHHDHPAASLSFGFAGRAVEHTIAAGGIHHRRELGAGQWRLRRAAFAHRIEIASGEHYYTLFIFFRNVREWGFHCPHGWVPWRKFVGADDPGMIGAGCGEAD
jgi:hypothetical protein